MPRMIWPSYMYDTYAGMPRSCEIDIFRFDTDRKVAEHLDVLHRYPIPAMTPTRCSKDIVCFAAYSASITNSNLLETLSYFQNACVFLIESSRERSDYRFILWLGKASARRAWMTQVLRLTLTPRMQRPCLLLHGNSVISGCRDDQLNERTSCVASITRT